MEILITGGAGFIPSTLADKFLALGHKVVLIDNFVTGKKSNLPLSDSSTFYEGDVNNISELQAVFNNHSFDYVFHFAAQPGISESVGFDEYLENNVVATQKLTEFMITKSRGLKLFIPPEESCS